MNYPTVYYQRKVCMSVLTVLTHRILLVGVTVLPLYVNRHIKSVSALLSLWSVYKGYIIRNNVAAMYSSVILGYRGSLLYSDFIVRRRQGKGVTMLTIIC